MQTYEKCTVKDCTFSTKYKRVLGSPFWQEFFEYTIPNDMFFFIGVSARFKRLPDCQKFFFLWCILFPYCTEAVIRRWVASK